MLVTGSKKYMSLGAKDTMGVFKFLVGLIDDLSHIICNFWWKDEEDWRKDALDVLG
jgi:hypothetical protein